MMSQIPYAVRSDVARMCRELADRGFDFTDASIVSVLRVRRMEDAGRWRALADMIDGGVGAEQSPAKSSSVDTVYTSCHRVRTEEPLLTVVGDHDEDE